MKFNRCRQIAKKYPVTRLFVALTVLTVALGTHTLLTASSIGQPLFEQGAYEKLQKSAVRAPSALDTALQQIKNTSLLGISVVADTGDMQVGDTVKLTAYGQFVNGTVPVQVIWMVEDSQGEREIGGCQMQKTCHYRVRYTGGVKVRAFIDSVTSDWIVLR